MNYIGNYDYYIEHCDEQMQRLFGETNNNSGATLNSGSYKYASATTSSEPDTSSVSASSANASQPAASSSGAMDWKAQKEFQAKKRKLETSLKKCEDEIAKLEARDSEINEAINDPSVGTDLAKLRKLTDEQTEIQEKLSTLYDEWEAVSSELAEL